MPPRKPRTRTSWRPPSASSRACWHSSAGCSPRYARRLLVRLLVITLALAGAIASAPSRPVSASPESLLQEVEQTPLPGRDPLDLAVRLRSQSPLDLFRPHAVPVAPRVGQEDHFWVVDQRSASMFQVRASIRLVTEHAIWYVEQDLAERTTQADLERSAAVFETRTYPIVRRWFGPEPSPGIDGEPRIFFLLGRVPGVAAYFSGVDAYPRAANPRSNERDLVYVNLDAIRPGQAGFDSTLAHEFQHLVHFARCPTQETWLDEGSAELAARVAGFPAPRVTDFLLHPDVQLTAWTDDQRDVGRHYQAAYLFLRYVTGRFGGAPALPDLLAGCSKPEPLVERFLATRGEPPHFDALFADWAVANLLDDPTVADGRFAYPDAEVQVATTGALTRGVALAGLVPQYAANYLEVPPGRGLLSFDGQATVPLVPDVPAEQAVWWSNRADNLDSRLTRSLDLRSLETAVARFRVWHDLEPSFDFAYFAASTDGGQTWQALAGRTTVADDALGNGYGVGWTGRSGSARPAWIDEEVDLTPFAGQEVLVRFEVLTDQGYSAQGFALDGFTVDGLDALDPAGWQPEGWLAVDGPLPQAWQVRLVEWGPWGIRVRPLAVTEGTGSLALDEAATRAVLVVAPTAPRTLFPAAYNVLLGDSIPTLGRGASVPLAI